MTITFVSIARQLDAQAAAKLPQPRRGMVRSALIQAAMFAATCAMLGAIVIMSGGFQ